MKNFKKIALGLLIGTVAIGFSSFTSAKKTVIINGSNAKFSITANNLVQPLVGTFEQAASASTDDCSATTSDRLCVYDVTVAGKANIPNQATYTKAEIDNYLSHSWITAASGASNRTYNQ